MGQAPDCLQRPGGSQAESPALSDEQRSVLELVKKGRNVFFTGKRQTCCAQECGKILSTLI